MKNNKEMFENNIKVLKQYVPIVSRVHGPSHPEFYEVAKVFNEIIIKVDNEDLNIKEELIEISTITNNYTIPNGVCESYEAVYNMLKEIDSLYSDSL